MPGAKTKNFTNTPEGKKENDSQRQMPFAQIPDELLLLLLPYLPTRSVSALTKSSRALAHLFTPILNSLACDRENLTSAVCCAAAAGNADLVQMLVHVAGQRLIIMDTSTPGQERRGDEGAVANYACREGAGLVVSDDGMRESALQRMVKASRTGVARLLLESAGVRIEWRNAAGWTALHEAAWMGHVGMVRLLLEFGAEVDARDAKGRTPLHFAVGCGGGEEGVQVLLDAGAHVNRGDVVGMTPLHVAAGSGGEGGVVGLLVRSGGDPGLQTLRGKTAVHFAKKRARREVVASLL